MTQPIHSDIAEKVKRLIKALTLKPALGLGTGVSTARITKGLSCIIKEGPWELKSDMPQQVGGGATGPTPGVLGRAALGSCLAIGYMIWASKLDVPIDELEVEVQADWDDAGTFGTSDVPAGYLEVRYTVRIQSNASGQEIIKVIEMGDQHSPYLDVFTRAQSCKRSLVINNSAID